MTTAITKRRRRWSVAWVAALALSSMAVLERDARADTAPSVWGRARDPSEKTRWELHKRVRERMANSVRPNPFFPTQSESELLLIRSWLEEAQVAKGDDPVLLFDLGIVYEMLELHEKAIVVLERGLTLAPTHPASDEAWLKLAFAYAKLDRPLDERRAYLAFLDRATQPDDRSVALLNFAETEMRLGRLTEAIQSYRDAMEHSKHFARSSDTYVLAVWGLAVALDRYGDVSASERETESAVRLDSFDAVIGNREKVFFVPPYERGWYLGLGASARARKTNDPRMALRFAQKAEAHFADYVAHATETDRWKALADKRLAAAKRERLRLEAKVRAMPRLPANRDLSDEVN